MQYDAVCAAYPSLSLLNESLSRFCALVEAWAWTACDPEKHGELERELGSAIDWHWAPNAGAGAAQRVLDPSRYQTNKPGESLLSVHRQPAGTSGGR